MPLEGPRAALLVIHGIGRQRPYETLDAFARGLAGDRPVAYEPRVARGPSGSVASVRMRGVDGFSTLDVVELHWAQLAEGRIAAWRVLWWWIRVGVAPLNFGHQLPLLRAERSRLTASLREAGHVAALLVVAAVALAALAWIAASVPVVARFAWALVASVDVARLAAVVAVFVPAGVGWALAVGLLRSWRASVVIGARHGGGWRGLSWPRLKALAPTLVGLAVSAWLVAALVAWWLGAPLRAWGSDLAAIWVAQGGVTILGAVAIVAIAWLAGHWLATVVGDLVLYVAADGHVDRQRTRQEIKSAAVEHLHALLTSDYDQVFVAGHSLGSVIAWDAVNLLVRRIRRGSLTQEQSERLRGILTFGSPLDKVHVFFRERVREDQAVRAQILSFLHAFRKRSSERADGPYDFERYSVPLEHVVWWNVAHRWDPIADPLRHYDVDERRALPGRTPFGGHGAYWSDPAFFAIVQSWLEAGAGRRPAPERPRGED